MRNMPKKPPLEYLEWHIDRMSFELKMMRIIIAEIRKSLKDAAP